MINHTLDRVSPLPFNDMLLIPIRKEIKNLFGKNEIEFQIFIKNNRMIIQSPEILPALDFEDNPLPQEKLNV